MIQQRNLNILSRLSISRRVLTLAFLGVISLSLMISGCAGGLAPVSNTPPPATPAPTVAVAASPTSISVGTSTTLTITATNATKVVVTGTDGSSYTMPATGGTQTVTPTATTTYTVTAAGAGTTGTVSAVITVTVTPPGPPTVTISANPTSINAGGSSTLTVSATNATQVTITGTDGKTYTLAATGGTQVVTPAVTTTYNATATGPDGTIIASVIVTVILPPTPTVTIVANPASVTSGNASQLTVTATNATQVTVKGSDGTNYTFPQASGGTLSVKPTSPTNTYTATASGTGPNATATATVTVVPIGTVKAVDHVIFMLQENHSFDNYFGQLNPYRASATPPMNVGDDGNTYTVDGLDEVSSPVSNLDDEGVAYTPFKLKSTCVDDMTSAWISSYGDVNRYDFTTTRNILMDGFVHNAEGFTTACNASKNCSGNFTDLTGQRAMGYYDQGYLNYYYYMASQFALSDRWFSPVSSKSIDNRIATFSGGTTQGATSDPGKDGYGQLSATTIFEELDNAKVSWKIYYTVTQGLCFTSDECTAKGASDYPATDFSNFTYSTRYIYQNPYHLACTGSTQAGDSGNSYCIDLTHVAPISQYLTDVKNNTLPSFSFIEAGYGNNDEHPGSGQSILLGQAQVASVINALMSSPSWNDSVFFLSYDEGGGPYDHVPPVPGHSNDFTNASLSANIPELATTNIAVNADTYKPCVPTTGATTPPYCDLRASDPGANTADAPAVQGFAAQLGFRVPNMIISPFTRKHYVSHIPMDHTAVIRFVEDRFIGNSTYLTKRDAAQPTLLDFFDFTNMPWANPPTPPAAFQDSGTTSCTPDSM